MPERTTINQSVQIGVEATPGTAVAASKRLQTIGIEPSPQANIDVFRPMGQKFPALAAMGKEWIEADVSGRPDYSEIIYPLSSVLTAAVVTTPAGGTTSRKWTFTPATWGDDSPKTFTIEAGSSVRAHRFPYALFTELSISGSRETVELGGSVLGRRLEDGVTLTATPTALSLVPVLPTQVDVFMDPTSGALGSTKLGRLLSYELTIGSRYNPLWVVDSSQTGFVAHVETEPEVTLTVTHEADAQAMALLTSARAGTTQFLRWRALGPIIEAAIAHSLTFDMAGVISEIGDFSDEDGVYAIEWTFRAKHDAGWGKALLAEVVNTITAL